MAKILVHEFVSLDGTNDEPTWTFDYGFHPDMGKRIGDLTNRSKGILLGRNTFEMFAQSWPQRTAEDDPGAPFFNDTTKYVVSGTLQDPESIWRNSKGIGAYDAQGIRNLKEETEGELFTSGSTRLVQGMLDDNLVDELHLCVYPLTRPDGKRLFALHGPSRRFELATSESYDNGVTYLAFHRQEGVS
jgi:dihydrofolate reductase